MRRPGVGSAIVRLVALVGPWWHLLSVSEYLAVWDDPEGYRVPLEFDFPKWTIWVVAATMASTVVLLVSGWWQRKHGGTTWWLAAAITGGLQAVWAVLRVWSFALTQHRLANSIYAMPADGGQFVELGLALIAALAAVLLLRDARDRRPATTQ